jgi:hypothetical protein
VRIDIYYDSVRNWADLVLTRVTDVVDDILYDILMQSCSDIDAGDLYTTYIQAACDR